MQDVTTYTSVVTHSCDHTEIPTYAHLLSPLPLLSPHHGLQCHHPLSVPVDCSKMSHSHLPTSDLNHNAFTSPQSDLSNRMLLTCVNSAPPHFTPDRLQSERDMTLSSRNICQIDCWELILIKELKPSLSPPKNPHPASNHLCRDAGEQTMVVTDLRAVRLRQEDRRAQLYIQRGKEQANKTTNTYISGSF